MAIASLIVLVSQNPRYFLIILLRNILQEGQETIIDPLCPLSNAPMPPMVDLMVHLIIVAIELWVFVFVFKIVKQIDQSSNNC